MLQDCVKQGLNAMKVSYTDFGLLTTPQLHWLVANQKSKPQPQDYIDYYADAFNKFCEMVTTENVDYQSRIVLDCANGVGAITFPKMIEKIEKYLKFELINT